MRGVSSKMARIIAWFNNNKAYLIAIVAFILGFGFLMNVLSTVQLKFENTELKAEIAELENRVKGAKQDLQQATTDAYIEEQATQRLGMVKSNETPVKVYVEPKTEVSKEVQREEKVRIYLKEWYNDMKIWLKQLTADQ